MFEDEKDNIERVKENLYSRNYKKVDYRRQGITRKKVSEDISRDWKDEDLSSTKQGRPEGFWIKWFLLLSILFFVVSFIIAAFVFMRGDANISSRNVDVRVLGPVSIAGGDELSFDILIDNKNNTTIEAATVFVTYPEGTRSVENIETELIRDQQEYGEILSGGTARKTFSSIFFGEKDSVENIYVTVEYRVKGSSATFKKEKTYEIKISSSPVIMNISYPQETSSNQEIEFSLDVISNSSTDLNNLLLTAEYPFGFSFVSSNIQPSFDTNKWVLGKLEPEKKVRITIQGVLQGQDNEERTFRFNIGTQSSADERTLGTVFVATNRTIAIKQTDLGLFAQVNGNSGDNIVIHAGDSVQTNISWLNNLPTRLVDAQILARFSGDLFDENVVSANSGGFYQSTSKEVLWTSATKNDLSEIIPGKGSSASFEIATKPLTSALASNLRNPALYLQMQIAGKQFSDGGSSEDAQTIINKTIKIASDLDLSARVLHSSGPIENSGPIPPKVGQATTYTVIWSLTNSFNNVSNVQVQAELPSYVTWSGITTPSSELISFDEVTRQITWDAKAVSAGAGYNNVIRQVAFRVSIIPSISQIGVSPSLLGESAVIGLDTFTNTRLSDSELGLTTRTYTDPEYVNDSDKVVQ